MSLINPNPPRVKVKLGESWFEFIEDHQFIEQPQSPQAAVQFLIIAYHMLKSLVVELDRQGLIKIQRPDDEGEPRSALDRVADQLEELGFKPEADATETDDKKVH